MPASREITGKMFIGLMISIVTIAAVFQDCCRNDIISQSFAAFAPEQPR